MSALRFPRCADAGGQIGGSGRGHQLAMSFVSRELDGPAVPAPTGFVGIRRPE